MNEGQFQVHIGHISGRNELLRWLALRRIYAEICSQSPIAPCMDAGRGRNGSTLDSVDGLSFLVLGTEGFALADTHPFESHLGPRKEGRGRLADVQGGTSTFPLTGIKSPYTSNVGLYRMLVRPLRCGR